MPETKSLSIKVFGIVQGVFFRDFIRHHAIILGLTGYVQNIQDDKSVNIFAEGTEEQLKQLLEYARVGPPTAKVNRIEIIRSQNTGQFTDFVIKR